MGIFIPENKARSWVLIIGEILEINGGALTDECKWNGQQENSDEVQILESQ